jgi:hypothetical protein
MENDAQLHAPRAIRTGNFVRRSGRFGATIPGRFQNDHTNHGHEQLMEERCRARAELPFTRFSDVLSVR